VALSMHVGLDNNYNSVHPHVRCDVDNTIFGTYYNSERKLSAYVGKKYKFIEYGLVTGYSGYDVAPMIRIIHGNWFLAPGYEVTGNIGLIIGMEYKL
tara:strand:+ start:802 stop:1092 length:291 start_codon:yes stop_codon:yes gene_type:complete